MRHAFTLAFIAAIAVGCHAPATTPTPAVLPTPALYKVESQAFGKARVAVGMTKAEVLKQIELSRTQYKSLKTDETDPNPGCYIGQPSEDTIESNIWQLTCPSRISHLLGGGTGMILKVTFTDGVVSEIEQLPWLGA
jgi:hypothetical protein